MIVHIQRLPDTGLSGTINTETSYPCFPESDEILLCGRKFKIDKSIPLFKYRFMDVQNGRIIDRYVVTTEPIDRSTKWKSADVDIYPILDIVSSVNGYQPVRYYSGIVEILKHIGYNDAPIAEQYHKTLDAVIDELTSTYFPVLRNPDARRTHESVTTDTDSNLVFKYLVLRKFVENLFEEYDDLATDVERANNRYAKLCKNFKTALTFQPQNVPDPNRDIFTSIPKFKDLWHLFFPNTAFQPVPPFLSKERTDCNKEIVISDRTTVSRLEYHTLMDALLSTEPNLYIAIGVQDGEFTDENPFLCYCSKKHVFLQELLAKWVIASHKQDLPLTAVLLKTSDMCVYITLLTKDNEVIEQYRTDMILYSLGSRNIAPIVE